MSGAPYIHPNATTGEVVRAGDPRLKMPTGRTRPEWRQVIQDDLAHELTDIELSERLLDASINRALDDWNKHRPFKINYPFEIPSSSSGSSSGFQITFFAEHALVNDRLYPTGFVREVVDVRFADRDRRILAPQQGSRLGFFSRYGSAGPRLFYQLQVGERTYEKLAGTQADWEWNPANRILYVSAPSRDVVLTVLATRDRKAEEIAFDRYGDFSRLCTAHAKYKLARNFEGNGVIPGPKGDVKFDGDKLREESYKDRKEVLDGLAAAISSYAEAMWVG